MTNPNDTYTSPLATRNASEAMLRIWSPRHKFQIWRRIWLAVAEAQKECGLEITDEQIAELRAAVDRGITDDEITRAEEYEREFRHDVMAHVHALGDACPKARPIIHLGMTSQDVVCNADLVIIAESCLLVATKSARAVDAMAAVGARNCSVPTLGFTHYQPAQPTTVGRRCAGWAFDLSLSLQRIETHCYRQAEPLRGFRGATGTQASFLELFGDPAKVDEFEARAVRNLRISLGRERKDFDSEIQKRKRKIARIADENPEGWSGTDPEEFARESVMVQALAPIYQITGQTYPRVVDTFILSDLAATAAVLHKIATDIRLLSNRKELDEPFGEKQVGSSAMPYKRNPMRCERICGLTRFVMNLVGNAYDTAATQWLERTLDDSSNRRLTLPEAFLALDGSLDLMHNVASGLIVNQAMVRKNLMLELPFMATENILMAAVKAGGDRQDLHERIRVHSQAAGHRVKQEGLDNDLIERLKGDEAFHTPALKHELDWSDLMDPMKYVGRAPEQVDRFITDVVEPLREQYGDAIEKLGDSEPRV
ncbi:MAG: adenylosuccinate lyase [Planctomycetes bacterium]|nr:adenylosuccinate lyase [Planctomycetota bacterium]